MSVDAQRLMDLCTYFHIGKLFFLYMKKVANLF